MFVIQGYFKILYNKYEVFSFWWVLKSINNNDYLCKFLIYYSNLFRFSQFLKFQKE